MGIVVKIHVPIQNGLKADSSGLGDGPPATVFIPTSWHITQILSKLCSKAASGCLLLLNEFFEHLSNRLTSRK
jgi:hypothetical protein